MDWQAPEKYSKDQERTAKLVQDCIWKIVEEADKNNLDLYDLLNVARLEVGCALFSAQMARSELTTKGRIKASGFKIVD